MAERESLFSFLPWYLRQACWYAVRGYLTTARVFVAIALKGRIAP